jgi:hypothetical protein
MVPHKVPADRNSVVLVAAFDTDSLDLVHHKAVELASVDNLAVDVDSDVDSCLADQGMADREIADSQLQEDPNKEQVVEENSQAPDQKLAVVDNSDSVVTMAVLELLKLAVVHLLVVQRKVMVPKLQSAALELVDWETLLEIADSIDCC